MVTPIDSLSHLCHEAQDVGGRSPSGVHHEICMPVTDAHSAARQTFKTQVFNKLAARVAELAEKRNSEMEPTKIVEITTK